MGTIRATSRIVYVDVIVRDGADNIVHGLQRDNFRIAEDRQPQKVSLFQAHVSPAQVLASQEQVRSKSSAVEISNRPPLAQDFNERQNGREVMNHIADETGGEAFYGNNDPATMLRKGFDDGENYYTLAYQPTDHNWNGQLRHIKVSLNGDGYQLSYRRSYLALPEQPAANTDAQFALAMRMGSPPSTALVLRATPPMEVKPGVMQLDASIDLQGIGFTVDDANERRGRLQVRLLAYPVSGPTPAFELNSVMKVGLTAEDYAAVSKTGIPVRQSLHLPAGQFLLCFGVLDVDTGRIGTLTLPVTVGSTTARVP